MGTAHRSAIARSSRAALTLVALCLGAALAGCADGKAREPIVAATPYRGPSIRTDTDARQHRVVLEAPSGGWRFTLDQVRKRFGSFDVYVTAREPDPTFNHTQAIVVQQAGTGVDPAVPIRVMARVIPFNANADREPYFKACESPPPAPQGPAR